MKKILLIASVFTSSLAVNAQLTQANHALSAGDSYQMYQCDSTAINPGAAGAGANWNFATINTHSSTLLTYSASAVTNTAYPAADVGVASSINDASYYKATANSLSYYGGNIVVGAVAAALMYTTAAINASYPMSLNTTSSTVTGGNINVTAPAAASGTFVGNSTVLADGTGSLTLPGAVTYSNVTRVVTTQTINFNAFISGTVTQINYEYFQPSYKGPLFSIRMATVVTSLGSNTQTVVLRTKAATTNTSGVGFAGQVAAAEPALSVYPNPSTSHVNFNSTFSNASQILIYDVTGKLVEKQNLVDSKLKLDVSDYKKGLYIYTLISDDNKKLKSGKITVIE